ncbi:MAG: hypothetical protein WCO33_04570 [bacterium]
MEVSQREPKLSVKDVERKYALPQTYKILDDLSLYAGYAVTMASIREEQFGTRTILERFSNKLKKAISDMDRNLVNTGYDELQLVISSVRSKMNELSFSINEESQRVTSGQKDENFSKTLGKAYVHNELSKEMKVLVERSESRKPYSVKFRQELSTLIYSFKNYFVNR